MAKPTLPIDVLVHWVDSTSDPRWLGLRKAKRARPSKCKTRGLLLKATRTKLVLAHTVSAKQCDYTVIPRGCVVSVRAMVPGKRIKL